MKRTKLQMELQEFPDVFHSFLQNAALYDSSCSPEARVYFIAKDGGESSGGGYYLKTAPKGTLEKEAEMTRYFHQKGLAAEVLAYQQEEKDWLLTASVPGEDCTAERYLAQPERLCDTLGSLLRELHETDFEGCPVQNRTAEYIAAAENGYRTGRFDPSLFQMRDAQNSPSYFPSPAPSPEEAWKIIGQYKGALKSDCLLHGDYCLPNVMLDDWKLGGFIDLGNGGVGDRHIDIFWGLWTLQYNLGTHRFGDRFLDAYGRRDADMEMLRIIGMFELFG